MLNCWVDIFPHKEMWESLRHSLVCFVWLFLSPFLEGQALPHPSKNDKFYRFEKNIINSKMNSQWSEYPYFFPFSRKFTCHCLPVPPPHTSKWSGCRRLLYHKQQQIQLCTNKSHVLNRGNPTPPRSQYYEWLELFQYYEITIIIL